MSWREMEEVKDGRSGCKGRGSVSEKDGFHKKGSSNKYLKKERKKQEEHWENRVNSATFFITLASSDRLVERH